MSHTNYDDEQLQEIVSSSNSWNEVLNKLGMKTMTRSLQRRIRRCNINFDNISAHFDGLHTKMNKFTREQIENIVKSNTDWKTVIQTFGYRTCNHLTVIKKKLNRLNIDFSHLDSTEPKFYNIRYNLDEILVEDFPYVNNKLLMLRLQRELGWQHICSVCNLSEWNGKQIPLEIDHIDGCHTNNTLTNLRTICPNCHAQTDTYKGRNMRVCKENKEKQMNQGHASPSDEQGQPEHKRQREKKPRKVKYCTGCSKEILQKNTMCGACAAKNVFESGKYRKVKRPSYEQLMIDIQQQSMVKVGQKYGVSDNAVRKWIEMYEKYKVDTPS